MRALLVSVLAMVLGVAAAWGATRYEFRHPERPVPVERETAKNDPKIEVEGGPKFDFGTMQLGESREHAFVLRNVGQRPLTLKAGKPSCGCITIEVAGGDLMPGESREAILKWTPPNIDEEFRKSAPVHTNDPDHLTVDLYVGGRVRESFKIEPDPVPLGHFSPTESNVFDVSVWGFREEPWKLQSYTCADTRSAEFFDLQPREMTAEELARMPGAMNGQVLKLAVKPGISLGNVQQRLKLAYRDVKEGTVDLQLLGKAVGDISVIGKDFSADRDYVDLGNAPSQQGKKSTLSLLVKGPHRDQVKLKVASVDPAASFRAVLGEPVSLGGKSLRWPLTIEIPPGAEPVNRLGSELGRLARIEFDTSTPDVPNFALKVRFSVTGDE